ncbi:6403_t:CDS:2, partial [Racocetra persica]
YNDDCLENYIDLNKLYNDINDLLDCDKLEYYKKDNIQPPALLEIGMMFDSFDYAEQFLNQYAKDNRFVVIKERCEKDKNDKSIIVRRTFEYHHGRSKKSKKVVDIMQQRDHISEKINCLWMCNINKIKSSESVKVTSFDSEYSQLKEYQNSVPTRGLPIVSQVIFPQIDSILIKFVISHILSIQRQQMNKSLLYCAVRLEVSEFNNNKQQISYVDLLSSYSYISLAITTDITTSPEEMHNSFNLEYLKQMRSNNMMSSEMSHNVSKKMRYLTRFGVLKKALNLSISLNCDDELLNILYYFIEDKQKLSTNYSTINNDNNKDHTNTNQNSDNSYVSIQVTDLLVV